MNNLKTWIELRGLFMTLIETRFIIGKLGYRR